MHREPETGGGKAKAGMPARWGLAVVEFGFACWVVAWGGAMAVHGARTGDVAGTIGAAAFLISLVTSCMLVMAGIALIRRTGSRWYLQAIALALFFGWCALGFGVKRWQIW